MNGSLKRSIACLFSLLLALGGAGLTTASSGILRIGNFSNADLNGWEVEYFIGETSYRLTRDSSGVTVLCAESRQAASGLVRKIPVDLRKTPYLNWSWRIDAVLRGHDEKTKQGDDYPARIYVVINEGPFFWQTKALNYVWANRAAQGSLWASPYISGRVKLIAVESGNPRKGLWRHEKRNIPNDLILAFGKPSAQIDAVAIMTDTDNTRASAKACYGDIFFSPN